MTTPATNDLCRLTVCGPDTVVEVAVPAQAPLADLLPALIGYLGDDLADAGLEHGGWVLQRLGHSPLDEDRSVLAQGLRDGDIVHLRPRANQLPPADFDDLIDGVATGIGQRRDRWRREMTRRLCLGLIPVPLAAGLALLALAHPIRLAATAAVTMTLLLLLAAMAASRAFGDTAGAVLFGGMSIGYAGLAGALVPVLATAGNAGGAPVGAPLGARLLAAAAAVAATAGLATLATGVARPAFLAVGIGALLAGGGTTVAAVAQASPAGAAGVLLLLVLPLGAFVPVFAARLARLRLPPLPTTPEELQADIDPEPSTQVLARTAAADRYMTALYGALGVVGAGCLAVLALAGQGTPARLLTTVAITLLALHARVMAGARQRLAALVPAVFGSALLIVSTAAEAAPATQLVVVGGLLVAACLLYAGAHALAGRRLLPYWGRIGDLAQTACALALLPLVLWVLDVYRYARGLGG